MVVVLDSVGANRYLVVNPHSFCRSYRHQMLRIALRSVDIDSPFGGCSAARWRSRRLSFLCVSLEDSPWRQPDWARVRLSSFLQPIRTFYDGLWRTAVTVSRLLCSSSGSWLGCFRQCWHSAHLLSHSLPKCLLAISHRLCLSLQSFACSRYHRFAGPSVLSSLFPIPCLPCHCQSQIWRVGWRARCCCLVSCSRLSSLRSWWSCFEHGYVERCGTDLRAEQQATTGGLRSTPDVPGGFRCALPRLDRRGWEWSIPLAATFGVIH